MFYTSNNDKIPFILGTQTYNELIHVTHGFSYSTHIAKFDYCVSQHGAGILS